MARYYTDGSGRHRPIRGRSLFNNPTRSRLYQREIRYDTVSDAKASVAFANQRWRDVGSRAGRVHLVQAMNEAANKAKVQKGEYSEEHKVLRAWVNEHKGKE